MTLPEPLAYPVLGTPVAATTYREAFERVSEWALRADRVRLVEAANTHVLALARRDRAFGEVMRLFDLVLPDGMPLVWVLNRRHGAGLKGRVYGPTFMAKAFDWSQDEGHRHLKHFLLGSSPDTLVKLRANLERRFPGATIAGQHAPPFRSWNEEDRRCMVDAVKASGANFVWTCFGCPKQETILARLKPEWPPGVYFGIGAAFAFHAGTVRQAPTWIQRMGMEWLFRLMTEPRRLFKRYLVFNSLFLWYLLADGSRDRSA